MRGRLWKTAGCLVIFIAAILVNALFIRSPIIWGLLSLALLVFSSYAIALAFGSQGLSETAQVIFVMLTSQILVLGYSLSGLNRLGNAAWWFLGSLFLGASVLGAAVVCRHRAARPGTKDKAGFCIRPVRFRVELRSFTQSSNPPQIAVLVILLVTLFIVGGLNLFVALGTAPGTWDSMTYHAARVAYYIQHGNLEPYPANYWAQTVHPKNATVLVIYAYVMSGLNDSLMQVVQFGAYWISIVCIYGICRRISITKAGSLFAAASFGLLIETLMEATTVQNDLLLTSYVGIMVYSLLSFNTSGHLRYLGLFAAALGIAIGVKSSAVLVMPSILVLLIFILASTPNGSRPEHSKGRRALYSVAMVGACLVLFALPSGYLENYQQYKHPFGPADVRQMHSFENRGLGTIVKNGGKNALRYGIDFANLDGFPRIPIILRINSLMRNIPSRLLSSMSVDLDDGGESRRPFDLGKMPSSHEDHSYWGILGSALILPCTALVALGVIRSHPASRLLGLAFLVFVVAQSFSGPYDPWRGRYFITSGVFAVPPVGHLFDQLRKRAILAYVTVIVCLGSASAVTAVCFREGRELIPVVNGNKSVFSMNRLEQMTVRRPFMYDIVETYERVVPASASVGLVLGDNEGEYLFFGEKLTRRITPLRRSTNVPPSTQYVVFQGHWIQALRGDTELGRGWYLRRWRPSGR